MKYETGHDSHADEDDDESDEEIIELRKEIEKKKRARRRRSEREDLVFASNSVSSPPISSTGTSMSSGSPRSSYSSSTFCIFHVFIALELSAQLAFFKKCSSENVGRKRVTL